MTEPPDHSELARRYLELWQEQISSAAGDPAVADVLARMMAGWQTAATQAFTPDGSASEKSPPDRGESNDAGAEARGKDGATSASGAPGGADVVIRELVGRVADLERRLEQLERSNRDD